MRISEKQNWKVILILLLLCCIQNIDIVSLHGAALKLGHVFSLVFFPYLLKNGEIEFCGRAILTYFSYMILIFLVAY